MKRILFVGGSPLSGNMGVPTLLLSTCRVIKENFPNSEFTVLSLLPDKDSSVAFRYGVTIIDGSFKKFLIGFFKLIIYKILKKIGINMTSLINDPILNEYFRSDIVIDILGISFTDFFPSISSYLQQSVWLLTGIYMGKPVIKYTQEMGPFENKINRLLARYCLNKLNFIMARSPLTKRYLTEIGIKIPIYVHPDTSFILEPAPKNMIDRILIKEGINDRPLVGIIASKQIDKRLSIKYNLGLDKDNEYITILSKLSDYLVESYKVNVIYIPNEISSKCDSYDDIYVLKKIYSNIKNKKNVHLIQNEYDAQEIKGLIKECDLVITSRYHSTTASLSLAVPCLVIGWGFKYQQVMDLMGQKEYLCNYETLTFDDVKSKLDRLWNNREQIVSELRIKNSSIYNQVFEGGKHVKDILKNNEQDIES